MKLTSFATLVLSALLAFPSHAENPTQRPNFLIILTDDHGHGDVSCYGARDVRTPHIDRLAKEGMRFTTMRANGTVCSPTRAAILTGRYADRVGVPGVIRTDPRNSWGYFDPKTPTLANVLGDAGYHTAIIGKWHLGLTSPNLPNERGFAHFHGFLGDMMDSYTTHLREGHNYMRHNDEVIDPEGHATDLFSDWAAGYLHERSNISDQPFFLYLAYNAPHFPIEPPAEWLARVTKRMPDIDHKRANNVAFVEHLDAGIGRVLAALDETGLARNTVVVFTADNGGALAYGQSNEPWRGEKQDHYDGGLRVPFIVRWPVGVKPGSRSDYAGLLFDMFPTFVELAGIDPLEDLDARSLVPILNGGRVTEARDLYFVRREGGFKFGGNSYEALIRGEWKILRNDPFSPYELYHLAVDPRETKNVATTQRKKFEELAAAIRHHIQRGGTTPWQSADD
ncbi:MAG: sulfatase-like hydrolase/transferase [Akkermansiaceae bacterium]|nr:sulfatase-like hydrolase/transferase [Akkermansiaceae bacterium]